MTLHTSISEHVQRARKIFQHEQRTNFQDRAIRPGGLEAFLSRWLDEVRPLVSSVSSSQTTIQNLQRQLSGYSLDAPAERAQKLQAAFTLLDSLDSPPPDSNVEHVHSQPARPSPITKPAINTTSVATVVLTPPSPTIAASINHATQSLLEASITAIPGIGASIEQKLKHIGLNTVRDLLFYFPREHRDYSKLTKIAEIPLQQVTTTMGLIWDVTSRRTPKGLTLVTAEISDDTGKLHLSWFNQGYLLKQLQAAKGSYLVVTGMKQRFGNKVQFSVRSHEFPEQGDLLHTGRLVPIYSLTEGLHEKALRRYTKWAADHYARFLPDHLPSSVREAGNLLSLATAVEQIHYPQDEQMLQAARKRLAFDELFLIQLGMQERRSRWQATQEEVKGLALQVDLRRIFTQPRDDEIHTLPVTLLPSTPDLPGSTLWGMMTPEQPFETVLPFNFTNAQRRVLCEIFQDLSQPKPMCRLLQGDVGSGKTAVAAGAIFLAILNGFQGALMAPTEILAEQHSRSLSALLEPLGIRTVLLTGSQRAKERQAARQALETGQAALAIGTHALIQDDVIFQRLGLVIIDEQHRFGVEQRDALRQKGQHPHLLVMTATPIPRTLALTLYGDLDVSVIDQLPPGRQKIITRWLTGTRRKEAYRLIAQQVELGRQAFIICPLIEESESLAAKAATTEYERLQKEVFPNLRLGLLHGAMKGADKDTIMRRFRDRELDILIATSVIEVGIDIPNASVMVVEDADRFGLSQLHQFRGRVGRGKHQSYCLVLSGDASQHSQERLGVFEQIEDGFQLSEEDLRLRGPGDIIGIRQSGMPELRVANLNDIPLIEETRMFAAQLWASDAYLNHPAHAALRDRMQHFWHKFVSH